MSTREANENGALTLAANQNGALILVANGNAALILVVSEHAVLILVANQNPSMQHGGRLLAIRQKTSQMTEHSPELSAKTLGWSDLRLVSQRLSPIPPWTWLRVRDVSIWGG